MNSHRSWGAGGSWEQTQFKGPGGRVKIIQNSSATHLTKQ